MKKYYYLLLTGVLAVASLSLTSCSDDDDDDDASFNIIGSWKMTSSTLADITEDVFDYTAEHYTQFKSDGTYIEVVADRDGVTSEEGTWSLNGDNLTMKNGGISVVYTVVDCNSKTMTISTFGFENVFTKVSDSVIEEYLNSDAYMDWDDWFES